jgi:cytochrome c
VKRFSVLFALVALGMAAGAARAQDLAGHGGPVRALAVLPDDGLASAGFDHSVILWDAAGGRARHVSRWHGGAVNALAALPGAGGGVASAGEDGRVAVWPPGGAAEPSRVLEGHGAPVAALAAGPGGALASAGWDGTVRVWVADGSARVFEGHAGPVNGLAWGAAGRLVSAGYDGTVRMWDAAAVDGGGGRVLAEFGLPQNAALVLPDGTVASAGVDGAVRLVAADGSVRELAAGDRPVVALAAAPDGACWRRPRSAAAWGCGRWRRRGCCAPGRAGPAGVVVAFAADGRTLWTGGQDRVVRRWDAATGAPLGPLASGADARPAAAGGDAHGARVFRACAACHALTPEGGANMAGPHLHGLFGRRMGSLPGYRYSERLARGDIVWTRETVADLFAAGRTWRCRARPCRCSGWRRRATWRRCCGSWRKRRGEARPRAPRLTRRKAAAPAAPVGPAGRRYSMMSSSQTSGRSAWKRRMSASHRASPSTTTSTPRERRNSSLPPKVAFSPTTTRGMPNCTIAPAHIMQGLSVV